MKRAFLLLVFCSVGLVCHSQTHREDSILKVHKIDSLIEAKTKAYFNNKFFTLEDTVFEVGSVLMCDIDYSYNKSHILNDSKPFLDSLKTFLTQNEIYINIESHTDYRGSEQYNLKLTDRRAWALKNYLTQDSLINKERISYKGYGENQPIIEQSFIDSYSEQCIRERFHATNRRTVFKITALDECDVIKSFIIYE